MYDNAQISPIFCESDKIIQEMILVQAIAYSHILENFVFKAIKIKLKPATLREYLRTYEAQILRVFCPNFLQLTIKSYVVGI